MTTVAARCTVRQRPGLVLGGAGAVPMFNAALLPPGKDTVGFDHVDMHVRTVMITWIGSVVEQTCREFLALQSGRLSC